MRLSNERFAELLDAYGADLSRWPGRVRAAAEAWLVEQPESVRLLDEASALDSQLRGADPLPPAPWLRQRILQRAGRRRSRLAQAWSDLLAELGGWRLAAPSLAAALCVGIALGVGLGLEDIEQQPAELMALLQLDYDDLEF